jgi:glutaminyl-peptide cyclotransferase
VLAGLAAVLLIGCSATAERPKFDGEKAFELLKKQVDFGPRYSGTPGHTKTADFLFSELKKYSTAVIEQKFTSEVDGKELEFRNIIASFNLDAPERVLLCAHWDTRTIADQEIDEVKKAQPILGANDGASGVAVLLEMARLFAEKPPEVGVVIVLFDGEDYSFPPHGMFIGSREFAKNWKKLTGGGEFKYGILLDMVGDANLGIYRERLVREPRLKRVNDKVWQTAAELGYVEYFRDEVKYSIEDDHLPLIASGNQVHRRYRLRLRLLAYSRGHCR